MDTITSICQQQHWESPELHALLNDLTHNDFNTVFRSVPALSARLKEDIMGRCFIARVAGSFYGRLFPSKTIHFVHSSYSLHWLSKGLVHQSDIDSFNFLTISHVKKSEGIIENEGRSGQNVANGLIAVAESVFVDHLEDHY
ncbi:hypothetical protein F3Y22_tig00110320pilonHSYRG00064 [Hibiscus syriacus]|uniref:Uncharacterized protein n=1 Tax=Hibiscus syriacus TaxID=106335 RepID=A0A6A3B5K3_HIBSY|nr:hypothetical protein F3Y22_tig00110320pilonHSYRG00064 [Hibiscus syriacus]